MDEHSKHTFQFEFETHGYAVLPVRLLSDAQCASFARAVRVMLHTKNRRLFNDIKEDFKRSLTSWHGPDTSSLSKAYCAAKAKALGLEDVINSSLHAFLNGKGTGTDTVTRKTRANTKSTETSTETSTEAFCTTPKNFSVYWQALISEAGCAVQRPHVDVVAGFKTKSLKGQFTVRHRPFVLFALEDDTRMRVWLRSHTKLAKYNGPPSKMPISTVREDDVVEVRVPKGHALLLHGDIVHAGAAYTRHNVRLLTFLYGKGAVDSTGSAWWSDVERIARTVYATVARAKPHPSLRSSSSSSSNKACGKRRRETTPTPTIKKT